MTNVQFGDKYISETYSFRVDCIKIAHVMNIKHEYMYFLV